MLPPRIGEPCPVIAPGSDRHPDVSGKDTADRVLSCGSLVAIGRFPARRITGRRVPPSRPFLSLESAFRSERALGRYFWRIKSGTEPEWARLRLHPTSEVSIVGTSKQALASSSTEGSAKRYRRGGKPRSLDRPAGSVRQAQRLLPSDRFTAWLSRA